MSLKHHIEIIRRFKNAGLGATLRVRNALNVRRRQELQREINIEKKRLSALMGMAFEIKNARRTKNPSGHTWTDSVSIVVGEPDKIELARHFIRENLKRAR